MVFKRLGVKASLFQGGIDLSFFSKLHVDAMRLDLGMSDIEEAALTKNKEGIKICINGATTTDHVGALEETNAWRRMPRFDQFSVPLLKKSRETPVYLCG